MPVNNSSLRKQTATKNLPPIPDKVYFSISEVSGLCHLEQHVLRYWEQEFDLLEPIKRTGNRRYYQRKDVMLIRHIRELLYHKGFTIDGARKQLNTDGNVQTHHVNSSHNEVIFALENILSLLED